jgi:polyhydroxybutyrate depolymerase
MSERIAAVAPVGAAMPKTLICLPDRAVPVVMINGTSDPIVPYGGSSGKNGMFATLSAEDSAKSWAKIDRCEEKPSRSKLPAKGKGGKETKVETYNNCQQGAQVVLYSVKDAGNTWPNGEQYEVEKTIGKTTHDVDANELMWTFFAARHLPAQERGKGQGEEQK